MSQAPLFPDSLDRTSIAFRNARIDITLDDLALMARALDFYLQQSHAGTVMTPGIPPDLKAALPATAGETWWIDSSRVAHVGRWRLESQRGGPTLVWYALVDAPVFYRYIASLDGQPGNWGIASLSVQMVR